MKSNKILLVCNIVMLLGLIGIYIIHFTGSGSKTNRDATAPVTREGGLTVAYINTDTLMAKYQYAIDLQAKLEGLQEQKANEYKSMVNKLQNDVEAFQNDYQNYLKNGSTMTLTQQQAKEKQLTATQASLQERELKLRDLEGQYAQQLQEQTLEESKRMTDAVYAFIREYNEANQQFDLVLSRSFSNSPILYGNPGMDITDEIIEGLNHEYKQVKGKD